MNKHDPLDGAYWNPVGHKKRVLYISAGQDLGGQGYRLMQALNKYSTRYEMRTMRASDTYLRYPYDLAMNYPLAAKLYTEADIVHHCDSLFIYALCDQGQRKPTVLHSHGSRLRDNPQGVTAEGASANATMVVSTVDLIQDAPTATWLPQCVADLAKYRQPHSGTKMRIGHAPTVRSTKGTQDVIAALSRLSRSYDIEVDLIEGVTNAECLARKGRCDIVVDQLTLGYGINGVEAMSMGIPVVSGFSDPQDSERFQDMIDGPPPFIDTTTRGIEVALMGAIEDERLRLWAHEIGREFYEEYHSEQAVVARLEAIYDATERSTGQVELADDSRNRRFGQMHSAFKAGFKVEAYA